MNSGSAKQGSLEDVLLNGIYTSNSGLPIPFTAFNGRPGVVIIWLEGSVSAFSRISGHGDRLYVTEESFEKFKSNVLDKEGVEWKGFSHVTNVPNVPGTWQSNKSIVDSYEGGKPKRNRPSSRRRPTKRRRSRRNVNRKTKKN